MTYADFKPGMYIKCVSDEHIRSVAGYAIPQDTTKGKIYKIERMWEYSSSDGYVCAHIINDTGYEGIAILYNAEYHIKKNIIYKWYFLFIPKIEWHREIKKEKIYFVPATEFEINSQKYNL